MVSLCLLTVLLTGAITASRVVASDQGPNGKSATASGASSRAPSRAAPRANRWTGLAVRDISILVTSSDGASKLDDCDSKACFEGCESDGKLGGACVDGECKCVDGAARPTRARVGGGSVRNVHIADCDDAACDKTCYEKGGFVGGSCNADGACECQAPEPPSFHSMGPIPSCAINHLSHGMTLRLRWVGVFGVFADRARDTKARRRPASESSTKRTIQSGRRVLTVTHIQSTYLTFGEPLVKVKVC